MVSSVVGNRRQKVRELAEAAFARVGAFGGAADRAELKEKEKEFEAAVLEFVAAAGRLLRGRESPSPPASHGA
jgi:hypothetical protein